jgi:hypothetical protein
MASLTAPVGLRMAFIRPDLPRAFHSASLLFHSGFMLRLISDPEGADHIFLQNVGLFSELQGFRTQKTVRLAKGWLIFR